MYRINNLKAPLDFTPDAMKALVAQALSLPPRAIESARLVKKSVDARNKCNPFFVISVEFTFSFGYTPDNTSKKSIISVTSVTDSLETPVAARAMDKRPVVIGLGPAGLFAALTLARAGLRPLVLERGKDVDQRAKDVRAFWAGGPLDPSSNVQFGEGGAGAFSDGKLTTGISDPRCAKVLKTLHEHGAPEEILYQAKPHIGTDNLPKVVRSIRREIIRLGGQVLFEHALLSLVIEGGALRGARARKPDGSVMEIDLSDLILAVGHSARDTFETLFSEGVPMMPKAFSIGARIEHLQSAIDKAQYGAFASHPALGAADYKLSARTKSGRGVYTFCMCPGGQVVAAASEKGGVVTNGMSAFLRDGKNANSALLAGLEPSDYGDGHPLSGVRFQRKWEQAAFIAGGGDYRAPAQLVGDFLKRVPSNAPGSVCPSYAPGVKWGSLDQCLPPFALEALREGIALFGNRLRGFNQPDAVLTGVETRSSSPLRILRNDLCQSEISGLYPCGEGAGYAGGILSAAVDGIRCAQALMAER